MILAVGWATVELDRAAAELGHALVPGSVFADAAPCELLGARCRLGRLAPGAAAADLVVLLEPSAEGRLAATLARHGEGWWVTWEDAAGTPLDQGQSAERRGPLGPERLVLGGSPSGPHRLLVTTATIVR